MGFFLLKKKYFINVLFVSAVYFETYGCQMNVSDTEVAWSILQSHGFQKTSEPKLVSNLTDFFFFFFFSEYVYSVVGCKSCFLCNIIISYLSTGLMNISLLLVDLHCLSFFLDKI